MERELQDEGQWDVVGEMDNRVRVDQVVQGNILVSVAQMSISRLASIFYTLKQHYLTKHCIEIQKNRDYLLLSANGYTVILGLSLSFSEVLIFFTLN